ncbi:MAG: hypothetical protein II903_08635, partial [Spirochaetales bacterium]|nr:hypothetical protein [Spirochaetales bacterium]
KPFNNETTKKVSSNIFSKRWKILNNNHFYALLFQYSKEDLSQLFFRDVNWGLHTLRESFGDRLTRKDYYNILVPTIFSENDFNRWLMEKDRHENGKSKSIVFKYNYCDGGADSSLIGFNGVCSDERIEWNINKDNRVWCSSNRCYCCKYLNKEVSREQVENYRNSKESKKSPLCYESQFLRDWTAGIGVDEVTQRPRNIGKDNLIDYGLGIMTSVFEKGKEQTRFIFAVFIIKDVFYGDNQHEGYVSAGSKDKQLVIMLTKQEAEKISYWKYYSNGDDSIRWSSNLYRFIDNEDAARILRDIVDVKQDPEEKDHAKIVLKEFCDKHEIDFNAILS